MDYKLEHKCEHLKSPNGWAAVYILTFFKDGQFHSVRYFDNDSNRIFSNQEEAKERNRELARHWLKLNDPDGRIYE